MSAVPATPSSGQQNLALWGSTFAFTVCFAVWTIFSIIGIQIKKDLGLSDTQFGLLAATPILTGSLIRLFLGVWTEQYGGRIGAAATQSATHWQTFFQPDVHALATTGGGLQQTGCPHGQVAFRGNAGQGVAEHHGIIVAWRKVQTVTEFDKTEGGLQQVITVGTSPDNVQEQIELGGGRIGAIPIPGSVMTKILTHGAWLSLGRLVHSSMLRRKSMPPIRWAKTRLGAACGSSSPYPYSIRQSSWRTRSGRPKASGST